MDQVSGGCGWRAATAKICDHVVSASPGCYTLSLCMCLGLSPSLSIIKISYYGMCLLYLFRISLSASFFIFTSSIYLIFSLSLALFFFFQLCLPFLVFNLIASFSSTVSPSLLKVSVLLSLILPASLTVALPLFFSASLIFSPVSSSVCCIALL